VGGVGFMLFSMRSHEIPTVFPNMFPIALTLSHTLWPKFYSCDLPYYLGSFNTNYIDFRYVENFRFFFQIKKYL
jgi:hypothetical protein